MKTQKTIPKNWKDEEDWKCGMDESISIYTSIYTTRYEHALCHWQRKKEENKKEKKREEKKGIAKKEDLVKNGKSETQEICAVRGSENMIMLEQVVAVRLSVLFVV